MKNTDNKDKDAIMRGEVAGYFYLVFVKRFDRFTFGEGEIEWLISTHTSFEWVLIKARECNQDHFLNINVEHFAVYFSEKKLKTYDKKTCVKIYPNNINSL